MMQTWSDRKGNFLNSTQSGRSLTPKLISVWREELDRTPERIRNEFNQTLNISQSPSFHEHQSSPMNASFTSKSPVKAIDTKTFVEPKKGVKLNRPNQSISKFISGSSSILLKNKPLNNQGLIQTQHSAQNNSNNENTNYLNQVNIMLQKMTKLKAELESSRERESDYLKRLSILEKENESLQALVAEKERKLTEITTKAKEDKVKMYQFLSELEAYKEANAELQKIKNEITLPSTVESDTSMTTRKTNLVTRGLQTIEEVPAQCAKCEVAARYCQTLMERLAEVDENSKALIEDYNHLRGILDSKGRHEEKVLNQKNDLERRLHELQKDFSKQSKKCNSIIAENSGIRSTIEFLSQESSNEINQKSAPQQQTDSIKHKGKIHFMPAAFKALAFAEKISSASFPHQQEGQD